MNLSAEDTPPTRPYLIRALYEWCTDNGYTPYLAVVVDASVQVPREFVKNNEIVLNIGMDATSALKLGNEWIEFKARFSGSAREIMVPISHVSAIYARENGQGMSFPIALPFLSGKTLLQVSTETTDRSDSTAISEAIVQPTALGLLADSQQDPQGQTKPPARGRPSLKRIK